MQGVTSTGTVYVHIPVIVDVGEELDCAVFVTMWVWDYLVLYIIVYISLAYILNHIRISRDHNDENPKPPGGGGLWEDGKIMQSILHSP